MNCDTAIAGLRQFRQSVFQRVFENKAVMLDLLDAVCSNTTAKSVVELSLNSQFRWKYSSLYQGIESFVKPEKDQETPHIQKEKAYLRVINEHLPSIWPEGFIVIGSDCTSISRRFAKTLKDCGVVYSPNAILNNKPITIGHQYSHLALLPYKTEQQKSSWVVPLSVRRVASAEKSVTVASQQVSTFLEEMVLKLEQLVLHVGDCAYSDALFSSPLRLHSNVVCIARVRNNRVFYFLPPVSTHHEKGHPTWYGSKFSLMDSSTWGDPQQEERVPYTTHQGKTYTLHVQAWENLIMKAPQTLEMHKHPFTLVRVECLTAEGNLLHKKPMWLMISGQNRDQITALSATKVYHQRYDLEHFFRFGKQHLLMDAFQTPEVDREENWQMLSMLAYAQLFIAQPLAEVLPRPWESKKVVLETSLCSPSCVQRDFARITQQIGRLTLDPKPRGKSSGRPKGKKGTQRQKEIWVIKGKKNKKSKPKEA